VAKELYIIDGSAYIYRAYHAVAPLTNSAGQYTHAVFGFVNMIRKLIREKTPEMMVVAWDSRGPVFRHEIYADYKANRPPMPEDLASQLPYIRQYVEAANIPSIEIKGVEADDIIATLAKQFGTNDNRVIIVSGDKDLMQLVNDNVTIYDPMKNKVIDDQGVIEKYGVAPSSLLDCFALMGDSSDNVPGVPGVGAKTAQKLISEYGSLDELYEQIDSMKKSKIKEKLIESKDLAYLSKELISLKMDVSVPGDEAELYLGDPNNIELKKIYEELGFTSLLQEVETYEKVPGDGFTMVTSREELEAMVKAIESHSLLAIDTETTSLDARKAKLVGISLAVAKDQCWYVPVGHKNEDGELLKTQLSESEVLESLQKILTSSEVAKLGHNLKYDYTVLRCGCGLDLGGRLLDTMLAAYLLDSSRRSLKLDSLCQELGVEMTSFEQVTGGDKREDCFAYVALENASNYACEDVYGALMLWESYEPQLKSFNLLPLLSDVEAPLIPVLAHMEIAGIRVDKDYLHQLHKEFSEKLVLLEEEIHRLAGKVFNINSPSQLGTILFEDLELPHGRKTKTGYSTDIKVLEKLAAKHDLPARVIHYRNLSKLLSTYVDKLSELADETTARVHTSFNQAVTATGRLSSSNPNMQNIPIRTEEGNRIRRAFVPADDLYFLSADYSQIDLRVMAHYSQDKALLQAFQSGADIHSRTAAQIFSISEMLVNADMRRVAKSINFGIVYGMSAFGLSAQLEISRKEAQQFIDRYFNHYAGVKVFMEKVVEQAREDGYVTTLLNRRRAVPEIDSTNRVRREFAERTAINTPIQGTAADIIKLAMVAVEPALKKEGLSARLLLQVHDELVFELPEPEIEKTKDVVRKVMESAMQLDVPLVVNFEQGRSLAKS